MENFELLTDDLRPCRTARMSIGSRFRYGVTMAVIKTLKRDLSNYEGLNLGYSSMNCCSDVKNTSHNWIYLTPEDFDLDLANRWISEISPIFPELELEILEINGNIMDSSWYSSRKKIPVIRALYHNKSYPVQAYLAHHLIRACFSYETIPYIQQYFKIKGYTPDLYFWNRIFLCQFGLKMYYYYWLTDRRTFRFTDKKEFEEKAYNYGSTSSLNFFELFKKDIPLLPRRYLQNQYQNHNFDLFISNMSLNLFVNPTDKYKRRCHNFDFSPKYRVDLETETDYIITADDYRQRKYKKTNFNIVEK